jgi:hypothetical protein
MNNFFDFIIAIILSGVKSTNDDKEYFKYFLFIIIFLVLGNLFYYIFNR